MCAQYQVVQEDVRKGHVRAQYHSSKPIETQLYLENNAMSNRFIQFLSTKIRPHEQLVLKQR